MALLARVSKMLNASHDVEELLTHMMDAVLESLNAQRGFVILGKGQRRKIGTVQAVQRLREPVGEPDDRRLGAGGEHLRQPLARVIVRATAEQVDQVPEFVPFQHG